jgi:hypothetical protein
MKNEAAAFALLIPVVAAVIACGEGLAGPEPDGTPGGPDAATLAAPLEATWGSTAAEGYPLSDGLPAIMTRTLRTALTAMDLRPDAAMRTLEEFLQQVEARDRLPTTHP